MRDSPSETLLLSRFWRSSCPMATAHLVSPPGVGGAAPV